MNIQNRSLSRDRGQIRNKRYEPLKSAINDRYACFHLQNSLNLHTSPKTQHLQTKKFNIKCVGSSELPNINQSTISTRSSSIRYPSASNQSLQYNIQPQTDNSSISFIIPHTNLLTQDYQQKERKYPVFNQQDSIFTKLIQDKYDSYTSFSSKSSFSQNHLKREKNQRKARQNKEEYENKSLAFYDSYCSIGSYSNSMSMLASNLGEQQIIPSQLQSSIPLSLQQSIPSQIQYTNSSSIPSLPLIKVKPKQVRSKSVISSNKHRKKSEQQNFNQIIVSKVQDVKICDSLSSLFEFSSSQLNDESQMENTESTNVSNTNNQSYLKQTPTQMQANKSTLQIDQYCPITQQFFKLICENEDNKKNIKYMRLNKEQIIDYLSKTYDIHSAEVFVNFLQYSQYLSFPNFLNLTQSFLNASNLEICLFAFQLYDINQDGFICNEDLFNRWKGSNNKMGEEDVNQIIRYCQNQLNQKEKAKETLLLIQNSQKSSNYNNSSYEDPLQLENTIISGNKNISLQKYRELKEKGVRQLGEIKSRQYTWYHKCPQAQEHYSDVRIIRDQISSIEETHKKITAKNISYNPISGNFAINFYHFYEIFKNRPPLIVYDIIASLTGYLLNNITYPYTNNQLLQKQQQLILKNFSKKNNQDIQKQSILLQIKSRQSVECFKQQFSQMLTNQ